MEIPEKTLRKIYDLASEYADMIQENLSWEEEVSLAETRVILGDAPSS